MRFCSAEFRVLKAPEAIAANGADERYDGAIESKRPNKQIDGRVAVAAPNFDNAHLCTTAILIAVMRGYVVRKSWAGVSCRIDWHDGDFVGGSEKKGK